MKCQLKINDFARKPAPKGNTILEDKKPFETSFGISDHDFNKSKYRFKVKVSDFPSGFAVSKCKVHRKPKSIKGGQKNNKQLVILLVYF